MEKKSIALEIKAVDDDSKSFTAYASVFGELDRVNDIVVSGAFKKSIETGKLPKMLWNHNPDCVIGVFDEVREDDRGLFVKGRFADTEKGEEVRKLVKIKAVDSLSIGYRTVDCEYTNSGERLLKEVQLWEISIVTFPALTSANIISAKAHDDIKASLMERMSILKR